MHLNLEILFIYSVVLSNLKGDEHNGISLNNFGGYAVGDYGYLQKVSGLPGRGYFMTSTLGTPAQKVKLLLDTGSSDLAVAIKMSPNVDHWFHPTHSSSLTCTGYVQFVNYQQGSWGGQLCMDRMQLDVFEKKSSTLENEFIRANLTFTAQLSLIDKSRNFFLPHNRSSWSGIAGLAFASLSVTPTRIGQIARQLEPTWITTRWKRMWNTLVHSQRDARGFWDNLVTHTGITNMFALLLCGLTQVPTTDPNQQVMSGTLFLGTRSFGSMNPIWDQIFYTPIVTPWYYEIVLTDILVENESVAGSCKELNFDKTIVDSGTTNIHLPHGVFRRLLSSIKQFVAKQLQTHETSFVSTADFWLGKALFCEAVTGLAVGGEFGIPYVLFPAIEVQMASTIDSESKVLSITLSPQQYLRYVGRSNRTGLARDCFAFGIQASGSGTILGSTFLEGFLTVFDRERLQVGFSNSSCNRYTNLATASHINGLRPWRAIEIKHRVSRPLDCAFQRPVYTRLNDTISRLSLLVALITCLSTMVSLPILCLLSKSTKTSHPSMTK